jgi:uncharacterized protein involved in exopolysaccharide biosynthesis
MWNGDRDFDLCVGGLRADATMLVRARWRIAMGCAAGVAAALLYVASVPAQYVARVDVALAPQAIANDGPEDVRHFHQIDLDSQQAATELEIVRSERVLRPVFDHLALGRSAELQRGVDGFWQGVAHLAHRLALGGPLYDDRQRASFAFASRVRCLRLGLSYVFEISYRSHDPHLAARVANGVAAQYLADRIARERTRRQRLGGAFAAARWESLTRQSEIARSAAVAGAAPEEDLPAAAARLLGAAPRPLSKSYPRTAPTLAFGAALGLLAGVVTALAFGTRVPTRRPIPPQEWASVADASITGG